MSSFSGGGWPSGQCELEERGVNFEPIPMTALREVPIGTNPEIGEFLRRLEQGALDTFLPLCLRRGIGARCRGDFVRRRSECVSAEQAMERVVRRLRVVLGGLGETPARPGRRRRRVRRGRPSASDFRV